MNISFKRFVGPSLIWKNSHVILHYSTNPSHFSMSHFHIKVLLMISLSCVCFTLIAQDELDTYILKPKWSEGDIMNYSVMKISNRKDSRTGYSTDTIRYNATLTVLEKHDSYYVLEWNFQGGITGVNKFGAPHLTAKINQLTEWKVVYTIDDYGNYDEISNWKELSEQSLLLMDSIMKSSSKGMFMNQQQSLNKQMRNVYATKEGIEQVAFKELQLIHFPYGIFLNLKEKLTYPELVGNPLGGKPLGAEGSITLEGITPSGEILNILNTLKLNEKDVKQYMHSFMKAMNFDKKKLKQEMSKAVFNIQDINRYAFDKTTGTLIKVLANRTTNIKMAGNANVKTDLIVIELVD